MEIAKINDIIVYSDVTKNPDDYQDEVVAVATDALKVLSAQIREAQTKLNNNLIQRMEKSGATKLPYVDSSGDYKEKTLYNGKISPDDTFEQEWTDAGFDPNEVGKYEYKPSWSKAKKSMKVGGDKKKIIEKHFREGKKYLK